MKTSRGSRKRLRLETLALLLFTTLSSVSSVASVQLARTPAATAVAAAS